MKTSLTDRYAELLPDGNTSTVKLVARLHALYHTPVPAALLARPGGFERFAPTRHRVWERARIALVAAASAIVLTGTAYAATTLLADTWQRDPGLANASKAGLVSEPNVSQTVNNVTVTVERAYADANRIAIGYSVHAGGGLGGQVSVGPRSLELREVSGRQFAPAALYGSANVRAPFGAEVALFEAPGTLVESAPLLQLELTIRDVRINNATVGGPWQLHFPLRVVPGRIASGTLTVAPGMSAGVRVVATPSETRVYVSIDDPRGRNWQLDGIRIETRDRSYGPAWIRCTREGSCTTFGFVQPLAAQDNTWTVAIDGLFTLGTGGVTSTREVIRGPWRLPIVPR